MADHVGERQFPPSSDIHGPLDKAVQFFSPSSGAAAVGGEAWHHFMELIGEFSTVSLLDLHPPRIFQIDGNMGGTACVCEMLMQSRKGVLHLLPALPKAWPKGRVENFYAQDGVKAAFSWDEGKLRSFSLTTSEDQVLTVKSGTQEWVITLQKDVPYVVSI